MLNHYIPDGRLFSPGLRGPLDRRRDGAVAAPGRRARPRRRRGRPAGTTRGASGRRDRPVPPPPGHRRRRLHRLVLRPRRPRPPRRDRDHGPRQADLRRQRGEPGRRSRDDPELAARLRFVARRHRRPGGRRRRSSPRRTPSSTSPPRSHVDRSILDPEAFLRTGRHRRPRPARGRAATARGPRRRFLQVSTDEVYGSVETGASVEDDALAPRSPYAAAKAAGELLVRSYVVTHGVDAVVTRGSNTYGPYHHPEKLIPLFVTNAIDDQPLPLYGDGLQRRDWLYVADHAAAIDHVLRHGATGETYNVPGGVRDDEPRRRRGSCSSGSASRGRSSATSRTGPATTGATRWTARSSRRSAGGRGRRSTTGWRRPSTGTSRTRRGGGPPDRRLGRLLRAPVRGPAPLGRA